MKKKLLVGIIMLCSIIFTGCVDADVTVDLEKDGTGKAIVEVLGPGTIFNNISEDTIKDWAQAYEKVEKISESDKTGYRFTTRQGPIDEVLKEVTNLNDTIDENGERDSQGSMETYKSSDDLANQLYEKYVKVDEEKGLFTNTYNIDLKLKDAIYSEMSSEQQTVVSLLGRSANIGLHIKAPIKAEGSNATSETKEDGKYVYNWDYTLADVQNINFAAKIPNVRNLIISAICILVVLIGLGIVLFRRRK
ncbi:hypothetical protein [Intestinibacter bartlettii]|uniref:DUF3153 domain-containing protein n=1 Tax=Intestinibacter bartlettii TaxID=261299 RepID=A0ABS6DX33_9FIRM|nr:hypothetical protein [Intestinibacter bartlettii]MBU5336415.1 hypothetical protein [Intestinibacter bartlettii]MDO5010589.1 hypothetical protein [Intestinibacter bartlettii]